MEVSQAVNTHFWKLLQNELLHNAVEFKWVKDFAGIVTCKSVAERI